MNSFQMKNDIMHCTTLHSTVLHLNQLYCTELFSNAVSLTAVHCTNTSNCSVPVFVLALLCTELLENVLTCTNTSNCSFPVFILALHITPESQGGSCRNSHGENKTLNSYLSSHTPLARTDTYNKRIEKYERSNNFFTHY